MDNLSKIERSRLMSRIRGKWTGPEKEVHGLLKGWKVRHRMHAPLPGTPDVLVGRTALFINGCFWHGHKGCFRMPKTNRRFWEEKIRRNRARDRRVDRELRGAGYRPVRIWECQVGPEALKKRLAI